MKKRSTVIPFPGPALPSVETKGVLIQEAAGVHNADIEASVKRLSEGKGYQDLSTVMIWPSRGMSPSKVMSNWFGMLTPMNQQFFRINLTGMEVGKAYDVGFHTVMNHPVLSKFKYILTVEDDNMVQPDSLLRLYEDMDKFDIVGGLYWTKGPLGQPMIYGDPNVTPRNFWPQKPVPGTLQPCNGLGMGFTLFKTDVFRNPKLPEPWFRTRQEFQPGVGTATYTQDLYFFEHAIELGYKVACDTRVLIGHYDINTDKVW